MDQHDHQQQKHVCKICSRTFGCGQSLGGHMRSHVMNLASDTNGESSETAGNLGFQQNNDNTHSNYSLRENPKKTTRFARPNEKVRAEKAVSDEKSCPICDKRFASSKALFGHMKCHSEKVVISSNIGEYVSSQPDENDEIDVPRLRRKSNRKMQNKISPVSNLSFENAYDSDSDAVENEQENVAMSLMMLSKDNCGYKELNSDEEEPLVRYKTGISVGNGVKMKPMEIRNNEIYSSRKLVCYADQSGFNKRASKRIKYQCTTCNKIFHSYQALGGHRASHKNIKGCFASKFNQPSENSYHESNVTMAEQHDPMIDRINKGKSKDHECPICFKVFSSGQALGGHKRSHLLGSAAVSSNQSIVIQDQPMTKSHDLLDLNLPAPTEDDASIKVIDFSKPWWALSGCPKRESIIRFAL
ncbi:hypothetical protein QQ045_029088 [Rhodiola kirilowii]